MSFFVFPDSDGLFADGTQALPGIAYRAQPSTGFWRISDGIIGVSGAGGEIARFSAPGGATPQLLGPSGAVATPGFGFIASTNSGFYYSSGINMSLAGALRWIWQGAYQYASIAGTGGLRHDTANQILEIGGKISTGTMESILLGNQSSYTASSGAQIAAAIRSTVNQTGTAGFSGLLIALTNTGLGSGNQRFLDMTVAGTTVAAIASDATMPGQMLAAPGSAARPGHSWLGFTGAGWWTNAGTDIRLSLGGVQYNIFLASSFNTSQNSTVYAFQHSGVRGRWVIDSRMDNAADASPGVSITQAQPFIGANVAQNHTTIISTINQTGTSSFSSLRLSQTQTALGSGAQRFLTIDVAGSEQFAITSDAATPARVRGPAGTTAAPTYSFLADIDSGMWLDMSSGSAELNFNANGVTLMQLSYATTAVRPSIDNTYSLGSAGRRWTTVWSATLNTGDIVMRDPSPSGKQLDQVAHWRLVEGADGIYAYNIRTGKKFLFDMTAADMDDADHAIISRDRHEVGWAA